MPTPLVADAITHYDELLAGRCDPSGWWQRHVDEVRRHWHDEAPMEAFVLRPLMVDEATYTATQASLAQVMRALSFATDRLAADEPMRRALGFPAYLEPLLELDREAGKPTCLGRLDGIMRDDGELTLIEFNSEPQSAPFQYELERSFERLPIAEEFARRFRVRTVNLYEQMYTTLAERGRGGRMPCVAILDKALWRSHRRAGIFRPLMYSSARGCPVLYVEPEELEYRDGKLTASGIQVDIVAFVNWEFVINAKKRLVKILKAIAEHAVEVFAGLSRGLLSSYKVVFELLSSPEYRDMFSPEVAAALARHVPWTRLLRERNTDHAGATVDLLPFVAANREHLVIKPSGGGGGANVTIGRDTSDEAWAQAIQRGVAQHWIVQELAVAHRQRFPVVDLGGRIEHHELACEYTPYVWNGARVEGLLCRVVAGSVISDPGDRAIGIANGVETATWIIGGR
ncbi:MAG TPA: hypothetical protein VHN14_12150 [Kofleriaceae bacterium]|jgi:hypothetical protein|nr:hypothetical protein [Kofleriaceae bacterium]